MTIHPSVRKPFRDQRALETSLSDPPKRLAHLCLGRPLIDYADYVMEIRRAYLEAHPRAKKAAR